jgi:hypothetical protein
MSTPKWVSVNLAIPPRRSSFSVVRLAPSTFRAPREADGVAQLWNRSADLNGHFNAGPKSVDDRHETVNRKTSKGGVTASTSDDAVSNSRSFRQQPTG